MKIIVIGSIAFDTLERSEARVEDVLGGSAVYFAYAASFFADVGIVGVVGKDFSPELLNMLKNRGIDIEGLKIHEGETFRWEGRYSCNMNERETISVCQNVFENFTPEIPRKYRKSGFVFLGNIAPCQQMEVLSQVEKPLLTAADTMDLWIKNDLDELMRVMKNIDMLVINDSEAKLLTGENNIVKALRKINKLGPEIAVIKRGENGAVLARNGRVLLSVPAYPLEKFADPTGAGDAFAGGMLGAVARAGKVDEETLKSAVAYGSVVASFCVEEFSLDKLKSITEEDINQRFAEYAKITGF